MSGARSVAEVLDLYAAVGSERYDEEVTQLEHALQCAALATAAGADDALVAAALLHDVGHLLELVDGGRPAGAARDLRHEARGADHLAPVFPDAVTVPIRLHVAAKRHLCTDPAYAAALSRGSVASLAAQGGPFEPDAARTFLARPGAADAIALRRWDDAGKVLDLDVPDLAAYAELLERVAVA